MDIVIGAEVWRRDGEKLAQVRGLVYDPGTEEVVSLIVEHAGILNRHVVMPIGLVSSTDLDIIQVDLTREQFDSLNPVIDREIAPPPSTAYTGRPIPDDFDVPDVPPVGAATGVEAIAFTPIVEEEVPAPSSADEILGSDTTVRAADGEIGHMKQVEVDDQTHRITSIVVEKGFVFVEDQALPWEWVASVEPGVITLTVSKSEVKAVNDV